MAAEDWMMNWLATLKLIEFEEEKWRVAAAEQWRPDKCVASLEGVPGNIDSFVEFLRLKKMEIKRARRSLGLPASHFDGKWSAGVVAGCTFTGNDGTMGRLEFGDDDPLRLFLIAGEKRCEGRLGGGGICWEDGHVWKRSGRFGDASKNEHEYQLLETLGQGGFATVRKCVRTSSPSETYAAKILDISKIDPPALQREMQIQFGLRHPRIVRLIDAIYETKHLYLVLEYMSGGPLLAYIGRLTEADSKHIFCQIVSALSYIHFWDIVYRDLKPDNILVAHKNADDRQLLVKLADFGCSKLINDGYSEAKTEVGTPQYWAPEVMSKQGYDHRVDLWSLGVTLYVMLMCAYPFDPKRNNEDIHQQILHPEKWLIFNTNVVGQAQELIKRLVVVQAGYRIPLRQCLEHPWVVDVTDMLACVDEEAPIFFGLQLPDMLQKEDRNEVRTSLLEFQQKFKCFAQVRRAQVIADLSGISEASIDEAKADLKYIVNRRLGIEAEEVQISSLSGADDLVTSGL